ncbi:MAG: PEP-CTERM sorting domain-containing protein [Chromatiales bacterium]|jgi:hypothetical protein
MKKLLLSAMFALGMGASTMTQAVIITSGPNAGTDAGAVDTLLEVRDKNDLDTPGLTQSAFELDFINDYADPDYTFKVDDYKLEDVAYHSTDEAGVYAIGPAALGDFFILKNSTYYALFVNLTELNWGVFDTAGLPEGMNLPSEGYQISHVVMTPTVSVPEPSAILLIAAGLAGLGFVSSKKK